MNKSTPYITRFTELDIHLFKEGKHYKLYEKLGAHVMTNGDTQGTYFAVWAPNASKVSVIGHFNGWNKEAHPMTARWDGSGIWECFVPNIGKGIVYKYHIVNAYTQQAFDKGDPFALTWEEPPQTASIVWDMDYTWQDTKWLEQRMATKDNNLHKPFSVYEVHLGSWRRKQEEKGRSLTYQEMADELVHYVQKMGFTHVEFLPIMEHPFFGSWGYQVTGYFAPSSRFGTPEEFMGLIDAFHQAGINVILDWVPSHFPGDIHGLHYFDGTHLYEHADPRQGYHPDWKSYIFNYTRPEVRSFLISNALFWLDKYHIDGLRVDAVASMLYLDYSREDGQWIPNKYGGKENLEAISLLKEFNTAAYSTFPDIYTIAEESTAWPGVSRPVYAGGLGFGLKWMMGWMHDTLDYFKRPTKYRRFHQNDLSFSVMYAFAENFMLPLSHDEVVHGKGSLLGKMPGDEWQRFANLRLMYAYMFTHPGAKLLFMGGELAQYKEWNHDGELDWALLEHPSHQGVNLLVQDLNALLKSEKALHELSFSQEGFEWIDCADHQNSVFVYIRKGKDEEEVLLMIGNFTPKPQQGYRIGLPSDGIWYEIFNSDHKRYWGSGMLNVFPMEAEEEAQHNRGHSIELTLPPLGMVILKKQVEEETIVEDEEE